MYILVNLFEVPEYLIDSALFNSFNSDDEESFQVPHDCFKLNTYISHSGDLISLMKTIRFWGVYTTPIEVTHFILHSIDLSDIRACIQLFPEYAQYFNMLLELKTKSPSDRIAFIVTQAHHSAHMEILQHLIDSGVDVNDDSERAAVLSGNLPALTLLHTTRESTDIPKLSNLCYLATARGRTCTSKATNGTMW